MGDVLDYNRTAERRARNRESMRRCRAGRWRIDYWPSPEAERALRALLATGRWTTSRTGRLCIAALLDDMVLHGAAQFPEGRGKA